MRLTAYAFRSILIEEAVLLVGGDKRGTSEKKFYERLIAKADARYERHLQRLKAGR